MLRNPVISSGGTELVVGTLSKFRSDGTVFYSDGTGQLKSASTDTPTTINVLKDSIIVLDGTTNSITGSIERINNLMSFFVTANFSLSTY